MAAAHEVLRVLAARTGRGGRPYGDGLRVALAIEGGGMRGVISAGMALELYERGLVPAFDAVYGASAGAITGAWLLSSRPEGLLGWTEPAYAKTLIRRSALLRGRPAVDIRMLIEELYQTEFPMDFASILASPVEYHPLATDAATGESTDLRPLINDAAELRLALRASASLPFLAGPPIRLRDRRFYDAAAHVPSRADIEAGMMSYMERELAQGAFLGSLTRHTLGLYHGEPGARGWRRTLSDHKRLAQADLGIFDEARMFLGHRAENPELGASQSASNFV